MGISKVLSQGESVKAAWLGRASSPKSPGQLQPQVPGGTMSQGAVDPTGCRRKGAGVRVLGTGWSTVCGYVHVGTHVCARWSSAPLRASSACRSPLCRAVGCGTRGHIPKLRLKHSNGRIASPSPYIRPSHYVLRTSSYVVHYVLRTTCCTCSFRTTRHVLALLLPAREPPRTKCSFSLRFASPP